MSERDVEGNLSISLQRYLERRIIDDLELREIWALRKEAADPSRSNLLKQRFINILYEDRRLLKERLKQKLELDEAFSNSNFIERIAEVAVERIRCWPEAPFLRIRHKALSDAEAKRTLQGLNFGIIYGAESILLQDTILSYQADEVCSRLGESKINILGVHRDWLTDDGRALRGMLVDDSWRVMEVEFKEPIRLSIIQVLHLPSLGEKEIHKKISNFFESLDIPQVNPYSSSQRADDKFLTHRLWSGGDGEIESPLYTLITRGRNLKEASALLLSFARKISKVRRRRRINVFIQPNTGTEGKYVERFTIDILMKSIKGNSDIEKHLVSILRCDDVLLREERGNVVFKRPFNPPASFRYISFRVNVAWDGSRFVAESGYAQVSESQSSPVASRGRGGEIMSLNEAFRNLYYRDRGGLSRLKPNPSLLSRIKRVIEAAAEKLNVELSPEDYLKMAGIDFLLEIKDKYVKPILLEANPRPSGLAFSVNLRRALNDSSQLMISHAIFNYIRSIQKKSLRRDKMRH